MVVWGSGAPVAAGWGPEFAISRGQEENMGLHQHPRMFVKTRVKKSVKVSM